MVDLSAPKLVAAAVSAAYMPIYLCNQRSFPIVSNASASFCCAPSGGDFMQLHADQLTAVHNFGLCCVAKAAAGSVFFIRNGLIG